MAASPDGSKIAYVVTDEDEPLVSTGMYVFIKSKGRTLNYNSDLVFRGGDMNGRNFGPLDIGWASNGTLRIGYCDGRTEQFRNRWLDAGDVSHPETEILLVKEAPGVWPASRPTEARAGPPPCT